MEEKFYMQKAIEQAYMARQIEEVPIGCVITQNDRIIGAGFNRRNSMKNALYHAEIIAINEASARVGDWRLEDCSLYVTVEPCPMCAGAIVQARIKDVIFGARNAKAGCGGSILNILNEPRFNHRVNVIEGVMAEECAALMSEFFKELKEKSKPLDAD